jgi:rhodanese-related sulfurtransferase
MLTIILLIIVGIILQFTISGLVVGSGVISGGSIEKVSPEDFENVIHDKEVFVLNVHTPYYGQIEGTDLIIEDWENIEKYMDKLPKDTSIPIAVYCRSGSMSGIVAEKLNGMGYKVYDLEGGMNSWENSGRNLII